MSVSGLEELDVWCKARDFAVRVNKEVFPLLSVEENGRSISRFGAHRKVSLQISLMATGASTFKTM